ncbi:MAG: peptidoglycan-binding protein [Clostridiaceae bacterium]|nr:peptidoglycan-binding protein [Clostridiaceae bacterium]
MLISKFMKRIGTVLLVFTLAFGIAVMQKPTIAKACSATNWSYINGTQMLSTQIGGLYNSHVYSLQYALNQMGYNGGRADGYFGRITKSAVILFQSAHGLSRDGIVGTETRNSINSHYQSKGTI